MILNCSDWLLVGSGPPHSQELGVAGASSSFSGESPPQTHGRVSASPISRPESAQYPKLSTPPRPGAVVARGLARAGMTPASCVPKKAVVRAPRPVSPGPSCLPPPCAPPLPCLLSFHSSSSLPHTQGDAGECTRPQTLTSLPLLLSSRLSGAVSLWPRGSPRPR